MYNYLNLPLQITYKENNFIHFVYSATGEKLQKIVTADGKVQSKTDYVNGIEYKNDVLQRIAHTEGSLSRQDDDKFLQEYVLRDHLGNTRVTFTDVDNDLLVNEKNIKQINNYYPFGLNMEGNWNGAAGSNKKQYNGKEWNDDFGLGWNDYGFRMYDPAMLRWVCIDPLVEKHTSWTGYNYVLNNPLKFIDLDGRDTTQRKEAIAKAQEYVDGNPEPNKSMYVMGAKGEPGEPVDCSGLASKCVKAGEEKEPNHGDKSSGVLNIESNTTKVELKDVQAGNLVTFRNTKKGSYPYHVGIVKEVEKDANGNPTKVTMIHSSGGKGPNEKSFNPTSTFAWGEVKVNGYYKWDTKPDAAPQPTIPIVMPVLQNQQDVLKPLLLIKQ